MDYSVADNRTEGDVFDHDILTLPMSEEDTARAIGNRIQSAEAFWNAELNLDKVRETNEKYYLSQSLDKKKLYDFQVPYSEPNIFIAAETLIPLALSRPPQPIVTQAFDTDASYELAQNLQNMLLAKYEDLYIKNELFLVARHLLIGYRLGVIKSGWDANTGRMGEDSTRMGDIFVRTLRPHKIVLAEGADDITNIPLIAESQQSTLDELCQKFPNKKDAIYRESGATKGAGGITTKTVQNSEVWFTYYDKSGKDGEAVAWKYKTLVLDAMKNPNWNYQETSRTDDGKIKYNNFFDKPQKPYALFNYLNLGRYVIDDTSLTEQAATSQDIVNKRGRQIVENADSANGGLVFNSTMIKQESVAKLVGNPREKVMVDGPVNQAVMRVPNTQLEPYVLNDKQDNRAVIDNVFSTHGAVKGERSGAKTLGQDVLSQRGDISRIQTLATAIEDGADRLYKNIVQLFKVFYDESQMVKYNGPDGKTSFMEFSNQSIEDGISVRVKTGSVLPDDPLAKRDETVQLMAVLDPLSIAEGLNKPNPKEWAERLFLYRMAPDQYMQRFLGKSVDDTGIDPSAQQEIEVMNSGQPAPPQSAPTKEHLATHDSFMNGPDFKGLPPEIQQLHMEHVKAEIDASKRALGQEVDTPEETLGTEDTPVTPEQAPPQGQPEQGMLGKAMGFLTQQV